MSADEDDITWPPAWGPPPPYSRPEECPPKPEDYSFAPGSYGFSMVWRGMVPMLGGYLQSLITAPATCQGENDSLRKRMQGMMAMWEQGMQDQTKQLWRDMDNILSQVTTAAETVSDLLTVPLMERLMYLFAATTALAMLSIAILLGI